MKKDTDVAGNPRIYGDTVDIGAYEYGLHLSISDGSIIEGDDGNSNMEFDVTLSDTLDLATTDDVTVDYTTVARTATDEQDFIGVEDTSNLQCRKYNPYYFSTNCGRH